MNSSEVVSIRSVGRARSVAPARAALAVCCLATILFLPLALAAQEYTPPAHDVAAGEHAAEEAHGESIWVTLARVANFVILVGGLYYFLRSPVANYLDSRSQQIRSDLEHADATRRQAAASLTEIETRLKALPAELETMRARAKQDIAAEEVRIKRAAEAESQRLVEQTRREINRQLQIAQRELTAHAADLAVGVARTRLAQELDDEQQARLIERYASRLGGRHE